MESETVRRATMDRGTLDGVRELVLSEELQPSSTEVEGADFVGAISIGTDAVGADADSGPTGPAWLYALQSPAADAAVAGELAGCQGGCTGRQWLQG